MCGFTNDETGQTKWKRTFGRSVPAAGSTGMLKFKFEWKKKSLKFYLFVGPYVDHTVIKLLNLCFD